MEYTSHYNSPLGQITLASNGTCLTGLWFEGQKFFARTLANCTQEKDLPVFHQTSEWLDCYFSGKKPDFTPALQLNDTPFRIAVWKILQQIPYGEAVTYKDIAQEIARQKGISSMSAQAIGGAVGHNPISIIIPCHRVIGSNGNLTGYAGGLDRKINLLALEGADIAKYLISTTGFIHVKKNMLMFLLKDAHVFPKRC